VSQVHGSAAAMGAMHTVLSVLVGAVQRLELKLEDSNQGGYISTCIFSISIYDTHSVTRICMYIHNVPVHTFMI
jgi:hypothetical protein